MNDDELLSKINDISKLVEEHEHQIEKLTKLIEEIKNENSNIEICYELIRTSTEETRKDIASIISRCDKRGEIINTIAKRNIRKNFDTKID